jgi:dCMP deaminase
MLSTFSWDEYFMTMAYLVAMKSRDPSTKVGAVIVGPDHEVRSTGYNGLPRGAKEIEDRYVEKAYKYMALNHAEENAILHCARVGVPIKGCKLYTPWIPCCRCTKAILQAGIIEVIYDENFPGNDLKQQYSWQESIALSRELMGEAGIVLRGFSDSLIKIQKFYREEVFEIW